MTPEIIPFDTRICECCGGEIGTYRFTVAVEFYQEVDIEAPNPETALRKLQDEMTAMPAPPPSNWFGGDMAAYDEDGNQIGDFRRGRRTA